MCAAAGVIEKISTGSKWVLGVTLVDDELFVLLFQADNQVAVYSVNDYQLLRHLNVPGFRTNDASDVTSCVRHKCLYMSDYYGSCVHRYGLGTTTKRIVRKTAGSKWPVPGKPCGLSVTPSCNLLVVCWSASDNKLVELSSRNGECVREIALQEDIVYPYHSVQLTTGELMICHGLQDDGLHRVCVVGDDGKVTRSYGGQRGSDVGQLSCPSHLAVDKDSQNIFVADAGNDRVVLVSPALEFVGYVSEGLSEPRRLHFHQATRRLFVGQPWDRSVSVIQLYYSVVDVPC